MLVLLPSEGGEKLLMGLALDESESAINRISNVRRAGGWVSERASGRRCGGGGLTAALAHPAETRDGRMQAGTDTISHALQHKCSRDASLRIPKTPREQSCMWPNEWNFFVAEAGEHW